MREALIQSSLFEKGITTPWELVDSFEERCAIIEYDAHWQREKAEQFAAKQYGFNCKTSLLVFAEVWEQDLLDEEPQL